jgi:acetolactate synthase-1/2/3 large subunit
VEAPRRDDPWDPSQTPNRRSIDHPQRAADVLVQVLEEAGVDVIFGLPGGAIGPVFDALHGHKKIRTVVSKHESAAIFGAVGYARATGKLGVAVVTSGPGLLNTMTGVAAAFCDGVPVLLLGGEVPRHNFGKGALQEGSSHNLNVVAMLGHITKTAMQVPDANAAPTLLRRAIITATSGRPGPVLLTLPVDTQSAQICAPRISQAVSTSFGIEAQPLEHAALALQRSKRKVIFAGSGVRAGEGPRLLRELAEKLQCPVMTTPKAKGVFPETHPLALGVFGLGGHPSAAKFMSEPVETVLAIGTSLNDLATNGWTQVLKPTRTLIHVDIDSARVGRAYQSQIAIAAPAAMFLEEMMPRVRPSSVNQHYGIEHHTDAELTQTGSDGAISPQRAIWELQQVLPNNAIYSVDSGEHTIFAIHYLQAHHPHAFMAMLGLGAMGSAIPAAIGTQLGRPSGVAVAICGDGGFAMTAPELATAAYERLPVIVMVMNDHRLGMVELGHKAHFGRSPNFTVGPMDVGVVSVGLGARTLQVKKPGDILAAEALLRRRSGPIVLDVLIDRTVRMPKNSRFEQLATDVR